MRVQRPKTALGGESWKKPWCDDDETEDGSGLFSAAYDDVVFIDSTGDGVEADMLESGAASKLRCPADRMGGYSSLLTPAVDYLHAMRVRRASRHSRSTRSDVAPTSTSRSSASQRCSTEPASGASAKPTRTATACPACLCGSTSEPVPPRL